MVATLVVQKLTHCGSMGVFAAPVPALVAGRWREPSRIGVRDMLSHESLMPAGAGTPRYEKLDALVGGRVQVSLPQPTPPLDSRESGNDEIAEWRGSTARSKAA